MIRRPHPVSALFRRRLRTTRTPVPVAAPTKSNVRQALHWSFLGSGWIAALAVGVLDLPSKINSFAKEQAAAKEHVGNWLFRDDALTGAWVSERPQFDVIEPAPDPENDAMQSLEGAPVHLQMEVYRGVAHGEIASGGLKKNAVYSLVQFEGRSSRSGLEGVVWDVIGGKRVDLATFTLTRAERAGEHLLLLKADRQYAPYLPKEAILWPTDEAPRGEYNPDYQRMLHEVVKDAARQARSHQTRR